MARILICEDSKLERRIITEILKKDNHVIVGEAINGQEAIDKFISLKPDLVTMDILMKPDGHSAIKKIKQIDSAAKIIIITSLTDDKGEVVQSVRLGAEGFIGKPINSKLLREEVNRILKSNNHA